MNLPILLHTQAGKMKLAVSAISHRNLDNWCENCYSHSVVMENSLLTI